jgi:hypothetical protein
MEYYIPVPPPPNIKTFIAKSPNNPVAALQKTSDCSKDGSTG